MQGLTFNLRNNLNIKKMIMGGLSLMTLLVCIVGILGTLGQFAVRKNAEKMIRNDIAALNYLNQTTALGLKMKDFAKEINTSTLDFDFSSNSQIHTLKKSQVEKVNDTYKALLDSLKDYNNATIDYPKAEELSSAVKAAATSLFVASRHAIETPSQTTLATLYSEEKAFSSNLNNLNSFSSTLLTEKSQRNISTANKVGIAILISTLLAALLSWLISNILWRNIFSKLSKLQEATKIVEEGKVLSEKDEPIAHLLSSQNAFGVLAKSLLDMSTSINQQKEDLKNTILFDTSTSLPNKQALNERLSVAVLKPKHNFALLLLSCDQIEKVKTNYGSHVRDALCQDIAIRISKNIKSEDFVVYLNRNEYAVLLEPIHSQEEVLDVAKRIMNSIALPFDIDDHIIDITGHLGIVFADHSYNTIDAVMSDAEMAMQKAKDAGPGRWKVFKTSIKNDHELRSQLVQDLREAIQNDGLEIYYQSIINLKKRAIDGFEALVRWKHSERGEIFPDTFIPIAEEHDLIYDLDLYVLRKASQQMKAWNLAFGNQHKVNINMSSQSLVHGQLLTDFDNLVKTYDLNPAFLSLDISENFLVENTKHSRNVLQKLRSMGVSIILDDFGTGYSAISNLQNSQVDEVKIDRSFIQDIHQKEDCLNVVRTIVTLAQNMKLHVTAEGVESKAQLYLLEELGCNNAQGYLFTKPKNIHDLEQLLEKQRIRKEERLRRAKSSIANQPSSTVDSHLNAEKQQQPIVSRNTKSKVATIATNPMLEEVQIQHSENQPVSPELATGAPKSLLLANSNSRSNNI